MYQFECNTHSLRYAFINHMINEHKMPLNTIAKIIGHANTNQLIIFSTIRVR